VIYLSLLLTSVNGYLLFLLIIWAAAIIIYKQRTAQVSEVEKSNQEAHRKAKPSSLFNFSCASF